MINFRFHLASLVAIFLALALGVVIGAGVIDRGVVDALDSRLNRVEANANRIQEDNDRLEGLVNEKDDAIDALSKQAIGGSLLNQDVGIVAVRGVDSDRIALTAASLRAAGADVTGVLWLESPWMLDDKQQVADLADAVGSSSRRPATLRAQAWEQLAARFASPPSLEPTPSGNDVLQSLIDAGFVTFEPFPDSGDETDFPGVAASIVLVVGSDGDVPASDVVMPAATALTGEDLPLVVGDVFVEDAEDAGERGDAFSDLRNSSLSTKVSTVDDLERPQGPPTVALAMAGLLRVPAVVGHFGLGPATVLLPEPAAS